MFIYKLTKTSLSSIAVTELVNARSSDLSENVRLTLLLHRCFQSGFLHSWRLVLKQWLKLRVYPTLMTTRYSPDKCGHKCPLQQSSLWIWWKTAPNKGQRTLQNHLQFHRLLVSFYAADCWLACRFSSCLIGFIFFPPALQLMDLHTGQMVPSWRLVVLPLSASSLCCFTRSQIAICQSLFSKLCCLVFFHIISHDLYMSHH